METAKEVAEALGGGKEKASGNGYVTLCPCHDDSNPSLSVTDSPDVGVAFYCFAGCDWKDIREAVKERGHDIDPPREKSEFARAGSVRSGRPVRSAYYYLSADGEVLYRKVRYADDQKPKYMIQRPQGSDWVNGAGGKSGVLYQLPEVIEAKGTVAFCEGEKDVETLRAHGITATTLRDGGGSDPAKVDLSALHGKPVVILPDNDETGRKYAQAIGNALYGKAQSVRIVAPDVKAEHEDVTDWFERYGGSRDALVVKAKATPAFRPKDDSDDNVTDSQPQLTPDEAQYVDNDDTLPAPVDILGVTKPPRMDVDLLPPAIAPYIKEQSELTGCDPGIIGVSSLVCLAACITDDIRIQPKRYDPTWTESARIWGAIMGDPSTKKSPGLKHAMKGVKRIDKEWVSESAKELARWQEQADAAKKDKTGEMPDPGEKPPQKRMLLEDTTVEALALAMVDNPQGLLVHQDELSAWFGSMDAYSGGGKGASKDRGHWLQAYNGGSRNIDRVLRGTSYVPNFSACVLGGIQPGPMRDIAQRIGEDGLLQRFLVVCAEPAALDQDRRPDMSVISGYVELSKHIASIQGMGSEQPIKLSEEAHREREINARKERRFVDAASSPHLKAWVGKWSGLFARLCLLYHVVDCASRGEYPGNSAVSGHTARQVRQFMESYLFAHALHFYTDVVDSHKRVDHAQQIASIIVARGWESFSRRDLARAWRKERKLEPWEIAQAIETLEVSSWIDPSTADLDQHRKARLWFVNPKVHEQFAHHAEEQRRKRAERRQVMEEMEAARRGDD
jgi:5S rRNA maturation endonuclease (ribonuclease M5)